MSDSLPRGWANVGLGDVAEFVMGQAPPGSECNSDKRGTLFVKAGEFGLERPLEREWTTRPLKMASQGDVLICVVGATAGKLNLGADCAIGRSVAALRPGKCVEQVFLFNYMKPLVSVLRAGSSGSAQGVISKEMLVDVRIGLPPLNEQRRIVAKLGSLQARTRRARQALDAVPALLEKLRQSILAAAFRGDLTKDWRVKNKNVETASELLKRIRIERRKKWEESELAKMTAKGKMPADDKWKAKHKEPEQLDASGLPELPAGWCWASVEELAFVTKLAGFEYTKFVKYDPAGDVPVIKAENVSKNGFARTEFSRVHASSIEQLTRSAIRGDDVLMVFVGAGLGQVARVPKGERFFLGPNVALIRCDPSGVVSEFVEYFFRSPFGFSLSRGESKATAQGSISMEQIRSVPVAVAPRAEQDAILERLSALLPGLSAFHARHKEVTKATGELERTVLARAFRGELVPQDPNDEPAEEMLKRVRAGAGSADGVTRKRSSERRADV